MAVSIVLPTEANTLRKGWTKHAPWLEFVSSNGILSRPVLNDAGRYLHVKQSTYSAHRKRWNPGLERVVDTGFSLPCPRCASASLISTSPSLSLAACPFPVLWVPRVAEVESPVEGSSASSSCATVAVRSSLFACGSGCSRTVYPSICPTASVL